MQSGEQKILSRIWSFPVCSCVVSLLSLRSPGVLTALSGASSVYSKLCLGSGSWIMFSSLVFCKYFGHKFKAESECIALVIFSLKYRSVYQTMTGHNWNLLVSMEVPWFVIAGIADSATNSWSACVGEWGWEARNLIAVICVLIPFSCESQYLSSNWAPTDLLIKSMFWCLWVLLFKN